MNTFALILCAIAVVVFVIDVIKARPWQIPLGLALFAAAFIVQLVFNSGPFVTH